MAILEYTGVIMDRIKSVFCETQCADCGCVINNKDAIICEGCGKDFCEYCDEGGMCRNCREG